MGHSIKYSFLILLGVISFSGQPKAQEVDFAANLQLIAPQGEYKENLDRLGGGINLNAHYRFRDSPFGVGLDVNFNNFGVESREEPLSSNIPDLRVNVENSYNLYQFLVLGKLQPFDGFIRPYGELLAGFNYLFTETSITERDNSSDPIASDTNFKDFALTGGGGIGIMIRVIDHRGRKPAINEEGNEMYSVQAGYINLGIRYLFGNEAEYLKKGSIQMENGSVRYDTIRSKTDMMVLQVGFVFRF